MEENLGGAPRFSLGGLILNLLTFIIVLAALGIAGLFAALFVNPYLPINPYPPPTLPPTLGPPTATPTPEIFLPPTWTPTPTITLTPTATPTATGTPTLTPTSTLPPDANTPTPGPPFDLQPGSPVLMVNFANDLGCDWMGVGGQVFDIDGAPIAGLGVHLEGELGGLPINLDALTGSASNLGPAGYLFDVSDHPIASDGSLWIQLNDTAGVPLSAQISLITSDKCDENLILVNWRQVR